VTRARGPVRRVFLPIVATGEALRSLKASESVARDIVDDIVTRGLQHGDRLPPEAAMLEEYGVSRETLREGLRLLEVQGLIKLRRGPGGGPIVGAVDPANLGRTSSLYYHLAGATYSELFEAWTVSECLIAELAAANPDRDAVRAALEPYRTASEPHEESLEDFVVRHSHFHIAVASLARNRVLQLSLMVTGQIITHHVAVNADPRTARETIEHDHSEIAAAIIAGRRKSARDRMEAHIRAITDFYRAELGAQMSDIIEWR
jgi:GntR family transcriptional regulator, transcriptional repressor for pyruvate dehydrogenase complex